MIARFIAFIRRHFTLNPPPEYKARAYSGPHEAFIELVAAFQPETTQQVEALYNAAALVPTRKQ